MMALPARPADGVARNGHAGSGGRHLALRLDGDVLRARILRQGERLTVFLNGAQYSLRAATRERPRKPAGPAAGRVLAPMPGKVLEVLVSPGQPVARGAILLVLEAMKVQMRITAPAEGTVTAIRCARGLVEDGPQLVSME
jgi:3-methylcrotonyl-CoA carboxylase alpha subunit